jgi:hypothetical protein
MSLEKIVSTDYVNAVFDKLINREFARMNPD